MLFYSVEYRVSCVFVFVLVFAARQTTTWNCRPAAAARCRDLQSMFYLWFTFHTRILSLNPFCCSGNYTFLPP